MKQHRAPSPSIGKIVKAQQILIDFVNSAVRDESKFIEDAAHTCWACGYYAEDFRPERAHIKAHSRGGPTSPENYVLLCHRCHKEHPDAVSLEVLREFLITRESHWDYSTRVLKPVLEALESIKTRRNAARELEEWCEMTLAKGMDGLRQIWRRPEDQTFGHTFSAEIANARWAIVEEFVQWLDQKRSHESCEDGRLFNDKKLP